MIMGQPRTVHGDQHRKLGQDKYVRLHIYPTIASANADTATAEARLCYIAETQSVWYGKPGAWLELATGTSSTQGSYPDPASLPIGSVVAIGNISDANDATGDITFAVPLAGLGLMVGSTLVVTGSADNVAAPFLDGSYTILAIDEITDVVNVGPGAFPAPALPVASFGTGSAYVGAPPDGDLAVVNPDPFTGGPAIWVFRSATNDWVQHTNADPRIVLLDQFGGLIGSTHELPTILHSALGVLSISDATQRITLSAPLPVNVRVGHTVLVSGSVGINGPHTVYGIGADYVELAPGTIAAPEGAGAQIDVIQGYDHNAYASFVPTYTNAAPTPVTIGGIPAGSTFTAQTMQQMFDALLYPYQAPAFSSFAIAAQAPQIEVGDSIPASVTFVWGTTNPANVALNSIGLLDITGAVTLATGLANDGSEPIVMGGAITKVVAATHTFRITGVNSLAGSFQRNVNYEWRWRAFWGNNVAATLVEADIEALAANGLTTSLAGNYGMGAGGYKFICVADAVGGSINTVKDSTTLFDVAMASVLDDPAYSNVDGGGFSYALVSVTNPFGVTANYRVYRTRFSLGSAITLLVT